MHIESFSKFIPFADGFLKVTCQKVFENKIQFTAHNFCYYAEQCSFHVRKRNGTEIRICFKDMLCICCWITYISKKIFPLSVFSKKLNVNGISDLCKYRVRKKFCCIREMTFLLFRNVLSSIAKILILCDYVSVTLCILSVHWFCFFCFVKTWT